MARTYRKHYRAHICCGRNTEYYRLRRREIRRKTNHELTNLFTHYPSDEAADRIKGPDMKLVNRWDEPTDGSWVMDKYHVRLRDKLGFNNEYYHRKTDRIFKPKHNYRRLTRR